MTRTTIIKKAIEAAEHPILLESPAQLEEAAACWAERQVLGIDTEFVRERTYRAALGLVQVSDGETAWLLDPLAVQDVRPLAEMLENPDILKILHSGSEDLEVLLNTVGTLPEPLVDSQVACAILGQPLQMGYHSAVQWLFDMEIDKEQTRSNWCKRPLQEKQLHYAAMDVTLLPEMIALLRPQLEEKNRWAWLQEDVARMKRTASSTLDPRDAYRRIGGAGRLKEDELRILRALAAWREETAIQRNLARGFVINDAGLMSLVRARPATTAQLRAVEGVHPRALQRYQDVLLSIIEQAPRDASAVEMPQPLDNVQRRLLKDMRQVVAQSAADLQVEPALLASRKELEKLIIARATGEPVPERFLGWRKREVTDTLLSILD